MGSGSYLHAACGYMPDHWHSPGIWVYIRGLKISSFKEMPQALAGCPGVQEPRVK